MNCPHCGYCPTCGRAGGQSPSYQQYPYIVTSGQMQQGQNQQQGLVPNLQYNTHPQQQNCQTNCPPITQTFSNEEK